MARIPVIPEIQWHEGMLLSPQHFQQMELRNQQVLNYHLHRLSPFHWGIHHIKFDPVVISTGLMRLLEIDAVMPDGLIVYRTSETDVPLELDLSPLKDDLAKGELTLYLAVPERSLVNSPVTGEWPRYVSMDGKEIIDENTSDNVIRIPRLIFRVSLIASAVPPARFESLPIARIIFQDESYNLTPYLPPCFIVHQNSSLGNRCATLALQMREKSAYLIEKLQNQVGTDLIKQTTEFLKPLAESLPLFEAIVGTGKTHPYDLYLNLCTIAGRLATLRLNQTIPSFPPYNHNEILKSINPLLLWLDQVIKSIERAYTIIPFQQNDRVFYYKLPANWEERTLLIGVRIPTTMSPSEMLDWVRECVIASESHLESARMLRVTGAVREIIEGNEFAELMPGGGIQLYRVQLDPHFIKTGENLTIFHAADQPEKRPAGIVLYAKGPYPFTNEPTEQEG